VPSIKTLEIESCRDEDAAICTMTNNATTESCNVSSDDEADANYASDYDEDFLSESDFDSDDDSLVDDMVASFQIDGSIKIMEGSSSTQKTPQQVGESKTLGHHIHNSDSNLHSMQNPALLALTNRSLSQEFGGGRVTTIIQTSAAPSQRKQDRFLDHPPEGCRPQGTLEVNSRVPRRIFYITSLRFVRAGIFRHREQGQSRSLHHGNGNSGPEQRYRQGSRIIRIR
jgi:hypothetical protein